MKTRRIDGTLILLILISLVSTLGEPVNPWPTDGWYQTRYALFDSFPGQDDYTPIAAPALLYQVAHVIATHSGLELAGEFYIASILQNVLILISACMLYYTLKLMQLTRFAAGAAIAFLLFVLSTGLPQAFWSENITLFLMASVVVSIATVLYGRAESAARFWAVTIVCGLCIGLLVITRVTPFLLIPGIALLFYRRMPLLRVLQFTATLTAISIVMLASMIDQNHARFGRYELTNSSGRHLWQGVKEITDRALANSSDYQALKQLNPDIQGKNWWEVPPVPPYIPVQGYVHADQREPLLGKLSRQAIVNAPMLYLMQGARKFLRSIGSAPYRLGYDTFGVWNPLDTKEFLPAPSKLMGVQAAFGQTVDRVSSRLLAVITWLYPISIFAIAVSAIAGMVEYFTVNRRRRPNSLPGSAIPIAAFICISLPFAALPILSYGLKVLAMAGSALCLLLLAVCASMLRRRLRQQASAIAQSNIDIRFFSFLAVMFFGTLWFSWQIEAADTRNTLPWLPFWSIMCVFAGAYWQELWHSAHG